MEMYWKNIVRRRNERIDHNTRHERLLKLIILVEERVEGKSYRESTRFVVQ
jgi:hypothetical protein